jgi:N-acetylmuramoyl-L-alanine amidase
MARIDPIEPFCPCRPGHSTVRPVDEVTADAPSGPKHSRLSITLAGILAIAGCGIAHGQSPIPPQSPPAPPPAPVAPQPRFVVVLDAGHGGDDSGGHLGNEAEKTFTLAMSVRLRSLLGARGIQVVTTRESDATVETDRRAEIANHANAQACISLHASESGSGVHLFASSLSPSQTSRLSAWRTTQAGWVVRSLALAGVLNSTLKNAGLTVTLGRTSLPTIDSMNCPAVALEIAPERGPGNTITAGLDDAGYQAKVAESLAAALLEWKTEPRQP